jgi:prophage maintenance system killer protein
VPSDLRLVQGYAFVDGNKRIGHAAMEVFLMLNGFELIESVDEQERTILAVASGRMSREALTVRIPLRNTHSRNGSCRVCVRSSESCITQALRRTASEK